MVNVDTSEMWDILKRRAVNEPLIAEILRSAMYEAATDRLMNEQEAPDDTDS